MKAQTFAIGGIACLMLLAGCGEVYQPIVKDTVMIKKINQVMPEKKQEYPGTLSEDTVKNLSVDAVNRLFHPHISSEDLSLEVSTLDLEQVKRMLYRISGDTNTDPVAQYEAYLNAIPNGIYRVIISNRDKPYIDYIVIMNAKDGDILEINSYAGYESDPVKGGSQPGKDELVSIARQFLKQLSDVNPDDLEPREQPILGNQVYRSVLFQNKETQNIQYVLTLHLNTREVVGFSKDIMSVFLAPVP
ncbi:hypothetical protein [Paenibacillus apis]|uniref:PepSY domain-containing protein n=1 Tax=Paenibacillus apis TaxID=1792174 RepID=A0A920CLF0_9BACL|nr:hypothetical protein [Paenibacillus apis]GIO40992.1 hypothetical protein J41TS4_07500 [Paenibacillus apis]